MVVSHRFIPLDGAKVSGEVHRETRIRATLILRRQRAVRPLHTDLEVLSSSPVGRRHASRDDHVADHGAVPDDLHRVTAFAADHGLTVIESSLARRAVVVEGSAAAIETAFGLDRMTEYAHPDGDHRGFEGAVRLPPELAEIVVAVLGLHTRALAGPRIAAAAKRPRGRTRRTVLDLAALYQFPEKLDGSGTAVAVIELGGGFREKDIDDFLADLALATRPTIQVHEFGGSNTPADIEMLGEFMRLMRTDGPASEADLARLGGVMPTVETTMDLQIVAALAPAATVHVVFAENTEEGLWTALSKTLHEIEPIPDVLSLSWSWTEPEAHDLDPSQSAFMDLIDQALHDAAHLGVTFVTSSGDWGSNPDDGGKPQVHFPASSPYALGCGGTTLRAVDGRIAAEVVWNASFKGMHGSSGGGVSRVFELPPWQAGLQVPQPPTCCHRVARGVPDVAGCADPAQGPEILVGGERGAAGGTSAVAPLWAALIARLNQGLGHRLGYLNPSLYRMGRHDPALFRDIVKGSNGDYEAGPGWNPCTGLGSPVGTRLLEALRTL